MRFSSCLFAAAALGALWLSAGCLSDGTDTSPGPDTISPGTDATLAFDVDGTLTLTPGEVTSVVVLVEPPARYEVSFYLVGAALDASLSPATLVTDPDGKGALALRAPNEATSFVLRATVTEGPSQDLPVAVSDQGFGSLQIVPVYPGQRDPGHWVAKVVSGTDCETLAASLPDDPPGALTAVAVPGEPLVVDVAPVGPNLAVAVRGGHYMWGCADESNLVAGGVEEVEVAIVDKPIDASEAALELELVFGPDPTSWHEMVDATADRMMQAMIGPGAHEAAALLDAMAIASGAPDEFERAADENGWLELVEAELAGSEASLERAVRELGVEALVGAPLDLTASLVSVPDEPGAAMLTMSTILGATPDDCGVPSDYFVTLSVDSADVVQVGGSLFWIASRVLGAAADRAAVDASPALPDVEDVPSWIAATLSCEELGVALGGFETCDKQCIASSCTLGLSLLWGTGRDASVTEGLIGQISLGASGGASFDDDARLTGFAGTWVGSASDGERTVSVGGDAIAQPPDETRPR